VVSVKLGDKQTSYSTLIISPAISILSPSNVDETEMRELKKSLEEDEGGIFKKALVPGFRGKDAFYSSF
jgi:hypothetical protein